MFRFTIRDVLWLMVVAALAVGWGPDRRQLAVDYTDYRRLKAEDDAMNQKIHQFLYKLNQPVTPGLHAEPETRQPVPGDKDYRFPPNYPLHYGPSASP